MALKSLADWLKENNKTQAWLAAELGISQTGVSRIIAGKDTRFEVLRRIHEITAGAVTPNMIVLGAPA